MKRIYNSNRSQAARPWRPHADPLMHAPTGLVIWQSDGSRTTAAWRRSPDRDGLDTTRPSVTKLQLAHGTPRNSLPTSFLLLARGPTAETKAD